MVEFYPRRSNQGRGSFLSGPRRCLLNAICLAWEELGGTRDRALDCLMDRSLNASSGARPDFGKHFEAPDPFDALALV